MSMLELQWAGPYSLVESGGRSLIYDSPGAATPGIYLWAIPRQGGYWINYVGIAQESVAARQAEHVRYYLSGHYTIYEPVGFAQGRRTAVYQPKKDGFPTFLSRHRELCETLFQQLGHVNLFYAPLHNADRLLLERVESSIIEALRQTGGAVYSFLDNMRISRWVEPEQRVSVRVHDHEMFEGMPVELRV